MSVLELVQRHRASQQRARQEMAIGADLIPRGCSDDTRYAGVDLVVRGQDLHVLRLGIRRLKLSPGDLPAELRATTHRIARELKAAGPEEIGRWATDVLRLCRRAEHFSFRGSGDVPPLGPEHRCVVHQWL